MFVSTNTRSHPNGGRAGVRGGGEMCGKPAKNCSIILHGSWHTQCATRLGNSPARIYRKSQQASKSVQYKTDRMVNTCLAMIIENSPGINEYIGDQYINLILILMCIHTHTTHTHTLTHLSARPGGGRSVRAYVIYSA